MWIVCEFWIHKGISCSKQRSKPVGWWSEIIIHHVIMFTVNNLYLKTMKKTQIHKWTDKGNIVKISLLLQLILALGTSTVPMCLQSVSTLKTVIWKYISKRKMTHTWTLPLQVTIKIGLNCCLRNQNFHWLLKVNQIVCKKLGKKDLPDWGTFSSRHGKKEMHQYSNKIGFFVLLIT